MKYEKDPVRFGGTFVLDNGDALQGENGRFRLSLTEDGELCYGYDGEVRHVKEVEREPRWLTSAPFTAEDRREIAAYMIAAWQRWAETGKP